MIGNGDYPTSPLLNPIADANSISERLQEVRFETKAGANLDRDGIFDLLDSYKNRFKKVKTAVFFYAGHGLQFEGTNYLVGVNAKIRSEIHVERYCVKLNWILKELNRLAETCIVFLDCCRNNPFVDEIAKTPSKERDLVPLKYGMSKVNVESQTNSSTFIAYAASPNEVAIDGSGDHSPFTAALLKYLGKPNQSIFSMMVDVANDVMDQTNNRQRPWSENNILKDFFFFFFFFFEKKKKKEKKEKPPQTSVKTIAEAEWMGIQGSNSVSMFEEFIRQHPHSKFRKYAKKRIEELQMDSAAMNASIAVSSPDAQFNMIPIRAFDPSKVLPVEPFGRPSPKTDELGRKNMDDPRFLEGLVSISVYSVAKLVPEDREVGAEHQRGVGTAFIVSEKDIFGEGEELFALTASHVVGGIAHNFAMGPENMLLSFEAMVERGIEIPPAPVSEIVWESPDLDCTILRMQAPPKFIRSIPIAAALPELDSQSQLTPKSRPRVVSISYPYGGRLKFGIRQNYLLDYSQPAFDDNGLPVREPVQLHYTAASEPGSSGCPILDENLEVIGLHLAGADRMPRLNGIEGHYAANCGIWIQSLISSAKQTQRV